MRRRIVIPAALTAVVLAAVLSVVGVRTADSRDSGTRTLPAPTASSETGDVSDSGDSSPVDGLDSSESVTAETGLDSSETVTPETGLDSSETAAETGLGSSETAAAVTGPDGGEAALSEAGAGGGEAVALKGGTDSGTKPDPNPDKPMQTDKPTQTEKPVQTDKPAQTEKTAQTGRPSQTEKPAQTEKPPKAEAVQPETGDDAKPETAGTSGAEAVIPPVDGPMEITMERPPFDGHYLSDTISAAETAVPIALVLRSAEENGGTSAKEWMDAHWEEWMEDKRFASEQEPDIHLLLNQDRRYSYIADDDSFRGQGVSIYDNATQEPVLFADLFSYLFQDNAAAAASDGTDAQSLRWVRLLGGRLYFSNSSSLDAERMGGRNGYLTAIDPNTGLLLWRTDPLVCCTENFEIPGPADGSGGVILCGGCSGENAFLYQVGMKTGEVVDRTPVESAPEWIVCANGAAYVHCADWDYVFDMNYN